MDALEELEVWKRSKQLAVSIYKILRFCRDRGYKDQITRASISVPSNIAEGYERYSKKEFVQYLYIARGSLYETITLLIIFNKNKWISEVLLDEMKAFGNEIGKMLSGLINSIKNSQVSS